LQKTLTETIDHGLAAISIDRVDYQNWLTLAVLYQELAGVGIEGAYEQAQTAYTSARNENPTNPVPVFRLAQLETARGNRGAAISNLDAALVIKPDFAPAHFLRSQLLAQDQRLEDAVASAVAVVQLVPGDPLGWYNLGVILYMGRSFNEAGAAFVQAVTLQPDYSNALFMLALTFHQVGQPEQAIQAMSRVVELNPTDTTVPAMIENIQGGKDPFDGLNPQAQ
jgi:tetratricopeptide (TPR) repeat protein